MRWQAAATSIVFITMASAPASAASPEGLIATPHAGVVGMTQSVTVIAPTARNRTVILTATQGAREVTLPVSVNRTGVGRTSWAPPVNGTWLISTGQDDVRAAQVAVSAMPTMTQVAVPTNPTQHYVTPIIATVEAGDAEALKRAGPITGKVVFTEAVRGVIGEARVETASDGTAVARLEWAPPGVATYAVTGAIIGELVASTGQSLAGFQRTANGSLDTPAVWGVTLLMTAIGIGWFLLVVGIERLATPWRTRSTRRRLRSRG